MSNCGTLRVLSLPLTSPHMDKENPGSKDSIANSLVAFICSILLYEVEWKDGDRNRSRNKTESTRERMNENQKRRGGDGFAVLTLRFIGNNPFTQTKHHICHLKNSCFHMKDQLN